MISCQGARSALGGGHTPSSATAKAVLAVKCANALLSTCLCSMDEADVLSDSIAILSSGRLCAHGSSLKLKDEHGG